MRAAGRGTQPQPITSPPNGSAYLASARAEWQPTDTEKFWIKPLYEDAAKGEKTLLMKVEPGAYAPLHAHEEFEQFYVLDGSLYDQEQVVNAGDYVCRAAGAMHSAGSDTGAIVLLIYTKAAPPHRS
jgi:quercetin dioxygenase-like cupin family protein